MVSEIPVVILCGGMGTRLSEKTTITPKPLLDVGEWPIVWHIMKYYSYYEFNEFMLALGYKGEQIKRYFIELHSLSRDVKVSLSDGQIHPLNNYVGEPWQVNLVDTGQKTTTGGRLKKLEPLLGKRTFMMTYGDGLCDVNLNDLLDFHRHNNSLVTMTAVRSPARFGALEFDGNKIRHFKEKSSLHEGWINGGFFVIEPEALEYIEGDVMWEHAPLERLAEDGQLCAYQHEGFWQCADTLRDLNYLESLWLSGNAPWKK